MSKIGEDVTERLMMIPRKVWVDRHHQAKYACRHCEGLSDESRGAVVTAKAPEALIPRSFATPELMAPYSDSQVLRPPALLSTRSGLSPDWSGSEPADHVQLDNHHGPATIAPNS